MRHGIVLGLLQGPAEIAPVSSSAHIALLADSAWAKDGAGRSQSFEVALHGGSALALALALRRSLQRTFLRLCVAAGAEAPRTRLTTLALTTLPPAIAGGAFERVIERRLGGDRSIAAGLALGALAMAIADRRRGVRRLEQALPADGLALGLSQAIALMPGVSRRGATLTAARLLGFDRGDADALSWLAALPVIAGACALKTTRRVGAAAPADPRKRIVVAGAAASFASTLAAAGLLRRTRLAEAPLAPFCAYRIALALLLLIRTRSRRGDGATDMRSRRDRP